MTEVVDSIAFRPSTSAGSTARKLIPPKRDANRISGIYDAIGPKAEARPGILPSSMTTLSHRLRALFLILLFLGGGTSLPSLDVLLFHSHGETSQAVAHIETSNGCTSHVGHCGVGCPASATEALGAPVVTLSLDPAAQPIALRSFNDIPTPYSCRIGFHSRAPPFVG